MKTSQKNQDGLVAIIVSSVIMVILSLVTLGFARLMQREQRQALDRSLSTQAFYAAESAVNDAVQKIIENPDLPNKTTCAADATFISGDIDSTRDVQYSCLLINNTPPSLEYSEVSISDFRTIPLQADADGVPITQVKIDWDDPKLPDTDTATKPNTTPKFSNCTAADLATLPRIADWSKVSPGMMQVDLIPVDPPFSRQGLIDNTLHLFLYPCASGTNAINYTDHKDIANQGQIVGVKCSAIPAAGSLRDCELAINMPALQANKKYFIRIKSLYRSSGVSIRIFDAAPTQRKLKKAQVQIDATGRVGDVLRRIQVRAPYETYAYPDYTLHTTDSICKQLEIAPAVGAVPATVNNLCPL